MIVHEYDFLSKMPQYIRNIAEKMLRERERKRERSLKAIYKFYSYTCMSYPTK